MSAPDILAEIKEDLGITDTTSDAWLQRRIDGLWSRMEHYTNRALCSPPQAFIDDWGRVVLNDAHQPMPPALWLQPRASVFLRYFPVATIEAIEVDGSDGDATGVVFDKRTGKLFSLTGNAWAEDLGPRLYNSRTRITYTAGWAEVPGDLYEIVLGAMQQLWPAKQAQNAGGIGGTVNTINVVDVGSVELGQGSAFVQATLKGVGTSDPLLGPYLNVLELYVDHRNGIGSPLFAVTEHAPP